ncbi:hypothetical protein chiPu_0031264, partial [Chiloscyllium punctatum]|nr:hypothetical protein [Chiloscyllium punctatum]
ELLGMLNLLLRRAIDRRFECAAEHVFGDLDQFTSHGEIVDGPAVVGGIDDRRRFRRQAREILSDGEAYYLNRRRKEGLQRNRIGDPVGADQFAHDFENVAVQGLEEMVRLQKVDNPVIGVIVDEDGAKQRLLSLNVLRQLAVCRAGRCCEFECGFRHVCL